MSTALLARRVRAFEPRAVARALTLIENQTSEGRSLIRRLYPHTGKAFVVGVTGSPGAGKSTLVDGLIRAFRKAKKRVGVIAVDPTSAFTGGSIMGDRIRMQKHALDPGVFIRSMATRGDMGGLAPAALDAVDLLDAAGCRVVLIETVGVGQDEVDVVHAAHAVLVLLTPGMGDGVQAIKAGLMEIADIFVINKADQPGAERLEAQIRSLLLPVSRHAPSSPPRLGGGNTGPPDLLLTDASRGKGLSALYRALVKRSRSAHSGPDARRRSEDRSRHRLESILNTLFFERLRRRVPTSTLRAVEKRLADRSTDPYGAAERLFSLMERKNSL